MIRLTWVEHAHFTPLIELPLNVLRVTSRCSTPCAPVLTLVVLRLQATRHVPQAAPVVGYQLPVQPQ